MVRLFNKISILILVVSLTACGGGKDSITDKKAQLEKLKKEQLSITDKIRTLETEISKLDTTTKKDDLSKLVGITEINTQDFAHYIDLQGRIDAYNISYISPRLGPGQVKSVYVTKGQNVRKGQLLLKLDDAVIKQSISAAKQNLEALKIQLATAKDVYNRYNNLWKQGIGAELQVINAKTTVEVLEKQIHAGDENIKTLIEQANATNIYSDVDGVADEVNIRVGETFSGMGATGPQIKIVNTSNLKLVTDVPENYSAKVKEGSKVVIVLADVNKTYNSTISFTSKVINPSNRSFIAEARVPSDGTLRPNQNAKVKIEDYFVKNALAIPVNTVSTDEKGKYVFVAALEGGKLVARKKTVVVGEVNNQLIEVKSGITAGDKLITEGYQNIYDGQLLKVQ